MTKNKRELEWRRKVINRYTTYGGGATVGLLGFGAFISHRYRIRSWPLRILFFSSLTFTGLALGVVATSSYAAQELMLLPTRESKLKQEFIPILERYNPSFGDAQFQRLAAEKQRAADAKRDHK